MKLAHLQPKRTLFGFVLLRGLQSSVQPGRCAVQHGCCASPHFERACTGSACRTREFHRAGFSRRSVCVGQVLWCHLLVAIFSVGGATCFRRVVVTHGCDSIIAVGELRCVQLRKLALRLRSVCLVVRSIARISGLMVTLCVVASKPVVNEAWTGSSPIWMRYFVSQRERLRRSNPTLGRVCSRKHHCLGASSVAVHCPFRL